MQQPPYPTPQSLTALLEQSQRVLAQVRGIGQQQPPRQELENRISEIHGDVRAMRKKVEGYRQRILNDENVALEQEIQQLSTEASRQDAAIAHYTAFLSNWQQTLSNISASTNLALSRSFRDETLIPPTPPFSAPSTTHSHDHHQYAGLDNVDENPYARAAGHTAGGALLLLPLASPLDAQPPAQQQQITQQQQLQQQQTSVLDDVGGFGESTSAFSMAAFTGADLGLASENSVRDDDDFLGASMDVFGAGLAIPTGITAGTQQQTLQPLQQQQSQHSQLQLPLQPPLQQNTSIDDSLFDMFGTGSASAVLPTFTESGLMGADPTPFRIDDIAFNPSSRLMTATSMPIDTTNPMSLTTTATTATTSTHFQPTSNPPSVGLFPDPMSSADLLLAQWDTALITPTVATPTSATSPHPPLSASAAQQMLLLSDDPTPAMIQPQNPVATAAAAAPQTAADSDLATVDLGDGFFDEFMVDP
ncbi:hypothetical protein DFJ77DRAFT_479591 [Powellomyces hirtus]|nr:hypothetical protein DFJ77DRAFT_479591 [Powellomyces hirtus]